MKLATAVIIVPLVALPLLLIKFAHPPWSVLRLFGLFLTLGAVAGITAARIQLGDSFRVGAKAKALITHGIYARIRNPVYVFGVLLVVGLSLYLDKPKYCWILLIVIPLQIIRARNESRVLEAYFGDSYREYKARTWF